MHTNGFTCDFWKLVERNFAMQESNWMLVAFLDSCIAQSLCIWIRVEQDIAMLESMCMFVALVDSCFAKFRSTGIQKHHDKLLGFLRGEIAP